MSYEASQMGALGPIRVLGCAFSANFALTSSVGDGSGGALSISISRPTTTNTFPAAIFVEGSEFVRNRAGLSETSGALAAAPVLSGGALYLDISVASAGNFTVLRRNRFLSNWVTSAGHSLLDSQAHGGAVAIVSSFGVRSAVGSESNIFDSNYAQGFVVATGGAISDRSSAAHFLSDQLFSNNSVLCVGIYDPDDSFMFSSSTSAECAGGHLYSLAEVSLFSSRFSGGSVIAAGCGPTRGGSIAAEIVVGRRLTISNSSLEGAPSVSSVLISCC